MLIGGIDAFNICDRGDKDLFLKPLEESSNILACWRAYDYNRARGRKTLHTREQLLDACADVMQAAVNCAAAMGVNDMTPYIKRCKNRNKRHGRY